MAMCTCPKPTPRDADGKCAACWNAVGPVDNLPWRPIHEAPHDVWLLLRGSSGRRDGIKRYIVARHSPERGGTWANRWRDHNENRVTDSGCMPSEFVVLQ